MIDQILSRIGKSELSLPEVFDLYFNNNEKLQKIIYRGSGHTFWDYSNGSDNIPFSPDGMVVFERQFTIKCASWPVTLENYDLFVEWADAAFAVFGHLEPEDRRGRLSHLRERSLQGLVALRQARLAARIVAVRYKAMIKHFRSGELVAFGHSNSGGIEPISPAIWTSSKIRVNFNDNEIHMVVPSELPSSPEKRSPRALETTRCLWFGIVVRRKLPEQGAVVAEKETNSKNVGGRPSEYPWREAIELLVLSYGKYGEAQSGAELYRRLADLFEYLGKPRNEINEDTIRLELDKKALKIKQAALGKLQIKPLPPPRGKRKPQKVR